MVDSSRPLPVWIDTDPGIDDALAILFAAKCSELRIEGVSTSFGNTPIEFSTRNALHWLRLVGRHDIPVYQGAAGPLVQRRRPMAGAPEVHGPEGAGSEKLPEPNRSYRPTPGYAAVELVRRVMEKPGELTILGLAPLTNIALAMRLEPSFIDNVRQIIWMGGIVKGHGNVGPFTTANVLSDVEAASIVFSESKGKLTQVGQDVTRHVRIEPERLDRIGSHGDVDKSIVSLAQFYRDAYLKLEDLAGFPVHDLVVIAFGLRPDWFTKHQLNVRVDRCGEFTMGMTVADFRSKSESPKDVTVCMATTKSSEILDWFEATLRRATR